MTRVLVCGGRGGVYRAKPVKKPHMIRRYWQKRGLMRLHIRNRPIDMIRRAKAAGVPVREVEG